MQQMLSKNGMAVSTQFPEVQLWSPDQDWNNWKNGRQ